MGIQFYILYIRGGKGKTYSGIFQDCILKKDLPLNFYQG